MNKLLDTKVDKDLFELLMNLKANKKDIQAINEKLTDFWDKVLFEIDGIKGSS